MKVSELREQTDECRLVGRRIVVTGVSIGEAERMGYVKDSETLSGQEGEIESVHWFSGVGMQLHPIWDEERAGHLALASEDEFEFICPACQGEGELHARGTSVNPTTGVAVPDPQTDTSGPCDDCGGSGTVGIDYKEA